MLRTISKNIAGQQLIFCNKKVLFWEAEKALIFSDIHIGKTAHFRKNGIAVPSQVLQDDLHLLSQIIATFSPKKLIIVGDFLHAGNNSDLPIFCEWRRNFPAIELILIKGNHDRQADSILLTSCIDRVTEMLEIAPFTLVHHPSKKDLITKSKIFISGHLHPGVRFQFHRGQSAKLPCFAISENQIILPAFSRFTGLDYKSLDHHFTKIALHPDFIVEF